VDGLSDLENSLTRDKLEAWMDGVSSVEVSVTLPKFRMTAEYALGQILKSMGMVEAFGGEADFSGMTEKEGLYISEVVHKTFVDVYEEGTEAAAATGVVMKLTAVAEPPKVFRADHPFLFLIRDNSDKSILFIGRMVKPEGKG
jgi:serpin B